MFIFPKSDQMTKFFPIRQVTIQRDIVIQITLYEMPPLITTLKYWSKKISGHYYIYTVVPSTSEKKGNQNSNEVLGIHRHIFYTKFIKVKEAGHFTMSNIIQIAKRFDF